VIAWFKESECPFCLWQFGNREEIILYGMLKVKYNNDFLFKESHQIHTKARKILSCLWINDVVVDTGFLIPYINFSGFNNVLVVVEFGRKVCTVVRPICPISNVF